VLGTFGARNQGWGVIHIFSPFVRNDFGEEKSWTPVLPIFHGKVQAAEKNHHFSPI
jgi:hypothetical protein